MTQPRNKKNKIPPILMEVFFYTHSFSFMSGLFPGRKSPRQEGSPKRQFTYPSVFPSSVLPETLSPRNDRRTPGSSVQRSFQKSESGDKSPFVSSSFNQHIGIPEEYREVDPPLDIRIPPPQDWQYSSSLFLPEEQHLSTQKGEISQPIHFDASSCDSNNPVNDDLQDDYGGSSSPFAQSRTANMAERPPITSSIDVREMASFLEKTDFFIQRLEPLSPKPSNYVTSQPLRSHGGYDRNILSEKKEKPVIFRPDDVVLFLLKLCRR